GNFLRQFDAQMRMHEDVVARARKFAANRGADDAGAPSNQRVLHACAPPRNITAARPSTRRTSRADTLYRYRRASPLFPICSASMVRGPAMSSSLRQWNTQSRTLNN